MMLTMLTNERVQLTAVIGRDSSNSPEMMP